MFLKRFFKLFGGKLSRWIKAREARDPEAVYESAIADRVQRYHQLKSAAAGVIYMRNKLERELREKLTEMNEVDEEAGQAADMNEDQCALILIQRKHVLDADCSRLREELGELTAEAEEAKKNLISFKGEIEKLKIEKVRMIARLKNAQARVRIQRALEEISYDEDVRALEDVRDSIQRMLAQAGVNREIAGSELDDKLGAIRQRNAQSKAQAELNELKRKRRPPLAPMDIFTAAAQSASNGEIKHAS
ncbi:MAG: PspA/IM30 family protein [Candidatus Binatus sp.]|uniref:PspA/IM30 family protein n=1 Tax=Candidatus Binatus sp. TaxID=2811406 RepID=UPI0027166971|nr:PspA/IM30 family protein [Candidatus Binatus sp.]MDO8430991.1 PspA/IM30 family protein [Candidatus Binatus sp.]